MRTSVGLYSSLVLVCLWAGLPSSAVRADAQEARAAATAAARQSAVPDAEYCGEYFLPSGKRVSVYRMGVLTELARLTFTNWENGRVGTLIRDSLDHFWAAPSPMQRDVHLTDVNFFREGTGKVQYLTIREGAGSAIRAERRETFVEQPVEFADGDVTLSGTLKTPLGKGPFPAIVLVHGSGPGTREQLEPMARFFVHMGLAVLSYDKRGCGASGGDWRKVDLEGLADDAVAAVSWLETQAGIDPRRVGLWGISQGGWITPLAASRSDKVAFVINHSGPGTSLRRQDTFMMANVLRDQSVSPADVDLVIAAFNALYDYGRKKVSAAALDAAMEKLRGKPGLEEYAGYTSRDVIPESLYAKQRIGDPAWFFHLDPDRDALAPYRRLRCPLLIVYGRLDYTVPVEESEAKITAVLREAEHPDFTIKVLDRAGHGMTLMQKEAPQKPVEPLAIVPEYFALLENWLRQRGFCGAAGEGTK